MTIPKLETASEINKRREEKQKPLKKQSVTGIRLIEDQYPFGWELGNHIRDMRPLVNMHLYRPSAGQFMTKIGCIIIECRKKVVVEGSKPATIWKLWTD